MFDQGRKEEVMDMLYEYRDVFSLREEIGICLILR